MISLSESIKICEAATDGPWVVETEEDYDLAQIVSYDEEGLIEISDKIYPQEGKDNAAFIAHARTALPEAISLIKRQHEMLKKFEWSGPHSTCPCCHQVKPDYSGSNRTRMLILRQLASEMIGHAPDCALAAVLKEVKE